MRSKIFKAALGLILSAAFPVAASAGPVMLAWDANTEPDLAGYIVRYGTTSGVYTNQVDVGNTTTTTINGLAEATRYYFAVEAYNSSGVHSDLSTSISYTVPATTPLLPFVTSGARLDLAWQNQVTGELAGWEVSGTSATSGGALSTPQVDPAWKLRALGDLNRDGRSDLIWQHTDGWVAVWFMQGNVVNDTRYLSINKVTDVNWKIVGSADFNNDGRDDLVWQHQTAGTIAVWLMWDNTVLDTRVISTLDPKWKLVGVGDLNRDGSPDFVFQHDDGWLAGWYIKDLAVQDTAYLSTNKMTDANWRIRGVKDLNGDLRADLIFEHQGSGDLAVWFMDGVRVLDTRWFSPDRVADVNWKIVGVR